MNKEKNEFFTFSSPYQDWKLNFEFGKWNKYFK